MFPKIKLQLKIMSVALRTSRFRLLLALGTVGLGIASMTIMLALSAGAESELQAITDQVGKNLFMVKAGEILAPPNRGGGWFTSTELKPSDVVVVDGQISAIRAVVPILENSLRTRFQGEDLVTTIRGVTPEYLDLRRFKVDEGRFLDERDGLARSRVAVAGAFVAEQLNDGWSLVGETVWINGIPFEIIGQLEKKGINSDGQNEDDQILIPLETARRRVFNVDYLSRLLIQVEEEEHMDAVQRETREILRAQHHLDEDVADDFDILTLIKTNRVRAMNSAFLGGLSQLFAVVTLVIGGIGVLAVTLLNMKDRIPEIGLRMAVGARRRDITNLFIAEACVLGFLGGLVGLFIGWVGILVLGQVTEWRMTIDLRGVVIPLLISILLGLVFGVGPALKASKVVPVKALVSS